MHSATQIIAQRAAPAIPMRNKTRWQPYYSTIQPALPPRSPTTSYLHTPTTHVSPSNQSSCPTTSAREQARPTPLPTPQPSQTPKDSSQRDANPKHKFAAGLIDQAVNIMSEIWRPHDVPDIFKASAKTGNPIGVSGSMSKSFDSQLPSLSTNMSKLGQSSASPESGDANLIPMKTFVHEVLKRSRTSASILQAALCYLEAIRPRVPEILDEERRGIRALYRPDSAILAATEEEILMDAELTRLENQIEVEHLPESFPTPADIDAKIAQASDFTAEKMTQDAEVAEMESSGSSTSSGCPQSTLDTPMTSVYGKVNSSSLPSPLLCPRRAFLASLILASKFFQDKCYSNRAWAKLSGLPPREIGRCERALGEALQWRLWVGKSTTPPAARPVVRSQTESVLITASSADGGRSSSTTDYRRPLRKAATMPYPTIENGKTQSLGFAVKNHGKKDIEITPIPSYVLESGSCNYVERAQKYAASEKIALEKSASTPSPDTPGLTYSPSCTDSSGGDQTIQVSYEGNIFPTKADVSQQWHGGSDSRYGPTAKLFSGLYGAHGPISVVLPDSDIVDVYRGGETHRISTQQMVDGTTSAGMSQGCLWHTDSICPAYQTASIH